ncbi:MAG: helix-turn-helix transcriptional regulator [Pirellulaceae bacterium]
MTKSKRLRTADVCAVHEIMHQCRDLGDDHWVWRRHLGEQLCRLLGGQVFMMSESEGEWPNIRPIGLLEFGWDGEYERATFFRFMAEQGIGNCEIFNRIFVHAPNHVKTIIRQEEISNDQWYGSDHFNSFVRPSNLDARIASFFDPSPETNLPSTGIAIHRPLKDKQFNAREKAIFDLAHRVLLPMLGRQLSSSSEPAPSELSPSLQKVLECVLEGDSEKQIASRLNLKPQTVHQYMKSIYRHFNAHSRAELLAIWVRRIRTQREPNE